MPSVLEDPSAPVVYRTSGNPPFLTHLSPLPVEIVPRQVVLRDRTTAATLVPFSAPSQVPPSLIRNVCNLLNREIEGGDSYPMVEPMTVESFASYWFGNFAAIMLLGDAQSVDDMLQSDTDSKTWEKHCLGSFYIKPNYPGRSSHVCNGGFLVSDLARNRGVGRLMGEGYLEWAPKLGYSYSVFNLVYETNVASCRIWDSLGFKRIGRVKGCGNLRSYPDQLIDAIQYGRELGPEGEEYASEERFDKIRYYLKHGKYPDSADRAEKSRLRSAATHYRLVLPDDGGDEKLMLKDKEVISSPDRQYEISRAAHSEHHAGINKTTAVVAERYHWPGIKTTVSLAIKDCFDCTRDLPKAQPIRSEDVASQQDTLQRPSQASGVFVSPVFRDDASASNLAALRPAYGTNTPVDPQLTHHSREASQVQANNQDNLDLDVQEPSTAFADIDGTNLSSFEETIGANIAAGRPFNETY